MSEIERYNRTLNPFVSRSVPPEEYAMLLQFVITDLLVEVQALRNTIAEAPELRARYAEHYRRSALLSHDAAGVMTTIENVIGEFINPDGMPEGQLREEGMLRKLGVDVEAYRREAVRVSKNT